MREVPWPVELDNNASADAKNLCVHTGDLYFGGVGVPEAEVKGFMRRGEGRRRMELPVSLTPIIPYRPYTLNPAICEVKYE